MKKIKQIFFVAAMLALFMMMPFPTTAATRGPDVVAPVEAAQDTSLQASGIVSKNVTITTEIIARQNYNLNRTAAGNKTNDNSVISINISDSTEEATIKWNARDKYTGNKPFTPERINYDNLPPDELQPPAIGAKPGRQKRASPANRTAVNKFTGAFGKFT